MNPSPAFSSRTMKSLMVGLLASSVAHAGISRVVLELQVSDTSGASASWSIDVGVGQRDAATDSYDWILAQPVPIEDIARGEVVATMVDCSLSVEGTNIDVNFTLQAGSRDTTAVLTTGLLEFGGVEDSDQQLGRATAAISVTDLNGDSALLRGLGTPGTGAFRARFNDGATRFTTLVSQVFVGAFSTAAGFQNDPAVGYRPVNSTTVLSMDSELAFSLTKFDLASATTTFDFIGPRQFQLFNDGDMNCDAIFGINDIAGFVTALIDRDSYPTVYPDCLADLADVDGDQFVSVGDISGFVNMLAAAAQ